MSTPQALWSTRALVLAQPLEIRPSRADDAPAMAALSVPLPMVNSRMRARVLTGSAYPTCQGVALRRARRGRRSGP